MDAEPIESGAETPAAILDALRDHPDWDEGKRAEALEQLIAGFPANRLLNEARGRLDNLGGGDGEAVLRLIEAFGDRESLVDLAKALATQPDLPPERAWDALTVLQGSGLVEADPRLAERWEELDELAAEEPDDALGELAAQLEGEDGVWIALQGLGAIEPAVRAEIVAGLAQQPAGRGLADLLRYLAFAHDPATRAAALDALAAHVADDPAISEAWEAIAARHPDPEVAARARRWLGAGGSEAIAPRHVVHQPAPRLARCLITALDGRGRGEIVLVAEDRGDWVAAAFTGDVLQGIVDVTGHVGRDREAAEGLLAESAARPERDAVEDAPALALGLLAGCLMLTGASAPPALSYWIERTLGPEFRPRSFPASIAGFDPGSIGPVEIPERARAVLDSCRDWVDDSPLTFELAEELLLRERGRPPDPKRDSGAFRFLFEHRLQHRLELDRRMLHWMAAFWTASGASELGRSALALAWQLADPQHAVPGHPFLAELARRSLVAAQDGLRAGIDPRRAGVGSAGPRSMDDRG